MRKLLLTVLVAAGCLVATAQWSDDPSENNRITPLSTEIYDHDLKVSKAGTSFVVFNRPTEGTTATFLQIVDVNGNMLFPEQGKLISDKPTLSWTLVNELLFVDSDGNAILLVSDCRNSSGNGLSYTLYKVSPTGEMLWGANGLDLCNGMAYDLVACMKIVQLEDETYVLAWSVYHGNDSYIQMQRISKTGQLLWNESEARIYNATVPHEYPFLVNAGNNQIIVVFSRGSMYSKTVRAQKFDINCAPIWANELNVYSGGFGMTPLWVVVRVIPDQMGGAFVGWFDDRNYTNIESTYVAHITANGTHGFASAENGEKVGHSSLRSFYPEMYFNKNEGFLYITWRETNGTQSWQRMVAQKMKIPTAELMWGNDGKEISPYTYQHSLAFYSIQAGKNDDVAVFFTSNTYHPVHFYGWDIQNITLLDQSGNYVWDEGIIEFSNPVGFKGSLISTPLILNNYWLAAWNDERKITGDPDGSKKVYMQRINFDGTLGDNGIYVCLPPTDVLVENITTTSAKISWQGDANDYEISYRIVGGEWVFIDVIGAHSYMLENLIPNTDYEVRVRSICSVGNVSEWSETSSFKTPDLPSCECPVDLKVDWVLAYSAKLSWKEGNDQNLNWDFRYREASISSWIEITDIEEKTYTLQELTPLTIYLWTVRSHCSEDRISDWSTEEEFQIAEIVSIENIEKERLTVYVSDKIINVINPENRYIEKIQLYSIDGRLIGDYAVKSCNNVLIPTALDEQIVIVKIFGENGNENHKVLMK